MVARSRRSSWLRWLAVGVFWTSAASLCAPGAHASCQVEDRPVLGLSTAFEDDPLGLTTLPDPGDRPSAIAPVPCHGEVPSGVARIASFEPALIESFELRVPDPSPSAIEVASVLTFAHVPETRLDRPPRCVRAR